jgi:2-keto-4-pentenoate hydratase
MSVSMPEIAPERFRAGMTRQLEALDAALAQGMPRRGWKVGINVPEVQTRLGLPHAGVGWLDGRCVLASGARLEAVADSRLEAVADSRLEAVADSRLHVEAEVALAIGAAVDGAASLDTARRAIATVQPALEIVDYALATRGVPDLIAHAMFHRAAVLGPARAPGCEPKLGTHFPALRVGSRVAPAPRRDLVPEDLGEIVRFVAAYLAAFGRSLEPGDLVLSGSYFAEALPMSPGDAVVADFGALGSVAIELALARV